MKNICQTDEEAGEIKARFLANMSHEIRTPIQTIIGMAELLEGTRLNNEQKEYSGQIKFAADSLLSLVNDILDYSKIETGKMKLERVSFPVSQIIEQAVDLISLEAHKKGLEIASDIPKELDIAAYGDPGKFRQVILHLLKNAVKFTDSGGVFLNATLANQALTISVEDTGIGISKEAKNRIFETFTQADASATRRFGGSGLGLSISHNMARFMNGNIDVVSNEKKGSTFRFTVPVEFSDAECARFTCTEKIRDIRVLVVDDSESAGRIISSYLSGMGCSKVDQVSSGKEALDVMRNAASQDSPYRICFLDMIMPETDISGLTEEIQKDKTLKEIDFVLMAPRGLPSSGNLSASGNLPVSENLADTRSKMNFSGLFKARIYKPVKRRDLAETVNKILDDLIEPENMDDNENNEPDNKPLVLIAEDNPVNQKLFALILEKMGFKVITSSDGLVAVEKAKAHNPDIIFMDYQMPRMNGYEAAKRIRELNLTMPIISVTAGVYSDEHNEYNKSGINDILMKPFRQSEIMAMIQKWLPESAPTKKLTPETKTTTVKTSDNTDKNEIFNLNDFHDSLTGNDDIACPLLERFIKRTNAQIKDIPVIQNNENWEEAEREAHTIKGSARTMGGRELGNAAAAMELACRNQEKDKMEAAVIYMKKAFARFRRAAMEYINTTRDDK